MDNINTEALFYSSSYTTKSGWKVTFQLPDEIAANALDAIGAGQRYMIALVPIGDDDQPQAINPKGGEQAKRAGILCGEHKFRQFLKTTRAFEGEPAFFVREYCGVSSRSELDHDQEATIKFGKLLGEYHTWPGQMAQ